MDTPPYGYFISTREGGRRKEGGGGRRREEETSRRVTKPHAESRRVANGQEQESDLKRLSPAGRKVARSQAAIRGPGFQAAGWGGGSIDPPHRVKDWHSARLSSAQLSSAPLSSAQLSSAQLSSAQLSSGTQVSKRVSMSWTPVSVRNPQLGSAQLSSAPLRSAPLRSALELRLASASACHGVHDMDSC